VQIIEKYNYAELKRKEGDGRLYLTPDGEALPSVTTILSKTKDKSFLKKWRAKVGEEKAEQIIRDSAQIGTALHLYIERFVNGDKYKDLTDVGVQAEKMAQKIIDEAFKQTNRPKKREWVQDYLMQLAAYAQAHNELFNTEIEQGVVLMCSRDLTFQRFELTGENFVRATNAFMKKLDAYNASII
jgi:genome maintenance exonuclease 1